MDDQRRVRVWMFRQFQDGQFVDDCCEADLTGIVEAAANYFNHNEWCDDPNHWVWETAIEAAKNADVTLPGGG